jgi:hypothetical protein
MKARMEPGAAAGQGLSQDSMLLILLPRRRQPSNLAVGAMHAPPKPGQDLKLQFVTSMTATW